jgi:hypothetical protein
MNKKTTIEYQGQSFDVRIEEVLKLGPKMQLKTVELQSKTNPGSTITQHFRKGPLPKMRHAASLCLIKGKALSVEEVKSAFKRGEWDLTILPTPLFNYMIEVPVEDIVEYE